METEPLERIDEHHSGETPEDVAILYSWANLQGAKYRDFSANRREYRAQMRHRAAEQLRLMELRAQSEAEAAAAEAEAEAAAAHAEADAATVKLAVSRSMPVLAPDEILKEKEVEEVRRSSLREAAQQARRAAAERLEAARRAEAAALADSIARREEREIAEAQASALRQAAQYHDSELRSRQMMAQNPPDEDQVPGRISDPYSPQVLAEGEYYDGPGTPPSELEASRFRTQREYIERSTGTELPKFKMPPLFDEDAPARRTRPESNHDLRREAREFVPEAAPRRLSEMDAADREYYADRQLREQRNASIPPKQWPGRQEQEVMQEVAARERNDFPPVSYRASRDLYEQNLRPQRAEVVSRIPLGDAAPRNGAGFDGSLMQEPMREALREPRMSEAGRNEAWSEPPRQPWTEASLGSARPQPGMEAGMQAGLEPGVRPGLDGQWQPRRGGAPPAARPIFEQAQPVKEQREKEERGKEERVKEQRGAENETPILYSVTPRPSGSWLRQISAKALEEDPHRASGTLPRTTNDGRAEGISRRPSVEATYAEAQRDEVLAETDRRPSGFRPPWLTQAQAARPSGARRAVETSTEKPMPQWLYTPKPEPRVPEPAAPRPAAQDAEQRVQLDAKYQATSHDAATADISHPSGEEVASRWFALKGVFARTDVAGPAERPTPREKHTAALVAVYSLAGGVGKTSLVATLGRTLSSLGEKVLLTDTTSHGLLPFYFGANGLASGVVRTFTPPPGSSDAPVHMVSYDLDRHGMDAQAQSGLFDGLLTHSQQVDRVLLDLNGNCGWMVERLARLKPTVLVPVAADMNSIVSLQAVEKKFASIQTADGQPLRPVYLLNQFDPSLPLHLDLREVLRQQLGDRLLPFVVRRCAAISEALAEGMTIVDYDPGSPATQDFLGLANWVRAVSAPAAPAGHRSQRWSEQ